MKEQTNHPAGPQTAETAAPHQRQEVADGQVRAEHPLYGNPFTNVGSADIPESPEAIRSPAEDRRSGPQLLDDDCYFG